MLIRGTHQALGMLSRRAPGQTLPPAPTGAGASLFKVLPGGLIAGSTDNRTAASRYFRDLAGAL